jgi:hypothetical protein
MSVEVGEIAPDFTLGDQDERHVSLREFREKKRVVLSFHPLARTGVCQEQMQDLEELREDLGELNAVALGLSVDSVSCKRAWAKAKVAPTNTPAIVPPTCSNLNVRLTSPGVNQEVRGNVPVRGTANIANFQYYKIEVGAGPNPQAWNVVGQLHHSPVVGGVLETFDSGTYPPGTYTLRLVTVDNSGNYPEPCRVTVVVKR